MLLLPIQGSLRGDELFSEVEEGGSLSAEEWGEVSCEHYLMATCILTTIYDYAETVLGDRDKAVKVSLNIHTLHKYVAIHPFVWIEL